mmetsp:Transcript_33861/g.86789  ORF Transcript_33861/g.86789 Transcript_33861/m.86789 type:complete len:260 (+) Transcript_33861:2283-3062(+)
MLAREEPRGPLAANIERLPPGLCEVLLQAAAEIVEQCHLVYEAVQHLRVLFGRVILDQRAEERGRLLRHHHHVLLAMVVGSGQRNWDERRRDDCDRAPDGHLQHVPDRHGAQVREGIPAAEVGKNPAGRWVHEEVHGHGGEVAEAEFARTAVEVEEERQENEDGQVGEQDRRFMPFPGMVRSDEGVEDGDVEAREGRALDAGNRPARAGALLDRQQEHNDKDDPRQVIADLLGHMMSQLRHQGGQPGEEQPERAAQGAE